MDETNAHGGKAVWFFAGAAIGLAVGILYAPKAGRETRKLISDKTHQGAEAVSETSREILERGREMYGRGRQLVEDAADLFERGRKLVQG